MDDIIHSRKNPIIKHVKSLHQKKYRDKFGEFFVEGSKIVEEALKEDFCINMMVISENFDWDNSEIKISAHNRGIDCWRVSADVFEYISDTHTPQGIVAVIRKRQYNIDDVLNKPKVFLTILDRVQDPGNVGTIIRTMDAAGGNGIILLKGSADPYNPKVIRSTMGSVFRVPLFEVPDFEVFFESLIQKGIYILVSHLEGDSLFDWQGGMQRIALVIGNESQGVADSISQYASGMIKIPIIGAAESLNASVAAGILIYDILQKCSNLAK